MGKISTFLALTIIIILAVIVGGGILAYQYWWLPKQETPPQESPSIKVLSPNGGEIWTKGQKVEILWVATEKIKYVNIRIGILGDQSSQNFNAAIVPKVPNNGKYEWTVQELYSEVWGTKTLPVSDKYFITVEDNERSNIYDSSDAPFSVVAASVCGGIQGIICPAGYECIYSGGSKFSPYPDATGTCAPISAKPFITVLSPNGGEVWQQGSKRTIRWVSSDLRTNQVVIELFYPGEILQGGPSTSWTYLYLGRIALTDNTGSFEWEVGKTDTGNVYGNNYKIRIREDIYVDIPIADDKSDAPFSITK